MDGKMDEQGQTDGRTDKWTDERTDKRDRPMNGRMDEIYFTKQFLV